MTVRTGFAGIVAALCAAGAVAAHAGAPAKPILAVNEDNDHYFKQDASRMTRAALEAYVDDLARGHVTHFFMCPQGQRASFDSKTWEPIWAGLNEPDAKGRTNNIWCVNAKILHDAGIDPYETWIARCRVKGVHPWLSMRMNDPHFTDRPDYFRHTTFWRDHPEYRRKASSDDPDQGVRWTDGAFDYAHPAVRDYHLAMARELIDRYDADGLELDWMRSPEVFKDGEARRRAPLLTDVLRQVRAAARAKAAATGRPFRVGVRVPALPVACAMRGMDVFDWAAEGLVDLVVVANTYHVTDYDLPFAEWRERLDAVAPHVVLLPSTDMAVRCAVPGGRQFIDAAQYRGWADVMQAQGAKGVYLFNLPYRDAATRDAVYGEGLGADAVRTRTRTYLVTERHDCLPRGGVAGATLPAAIDGDRAFTVRVGTPPASGRASVVLGFSTRDARFASVPVRLNGEAALDAPREEPDLARYGGQTFCAYALRTTFPAAALTAGENLVELVFRQMKSTAKITWISVETDAPAAPVAEAAPSRAAVDDRAAARPILAINEDNDHYFKQDASRMTEAALEAYARDIFRGSVTHFFMCPQGQRASFDSRTWEPIWAGLNDPDKEGRTNNIWCVNAKILRDAGIDPYRVWIRCARERGVSPWMSMRMNDIHFCTVSNYFRNTTFWKTRPDLRCVPEATDGKWEQFCFDYSHAEVRAYHLAMARELLERYDADGLELDFLRFAWYFKPGENRRHAHILTDFIRSVRAAADEAGQRRGRRIRLSARVPALPVMCTAQGMDTEVWARERLIDGLVVCNQHPCVDDDLPFADWRRRMAAANPDLVLLPGTDHKISTGGADIELLAPADYRGWADVMLAQGARGLYLFNAPYNPKATRDELYGNGLSADAVAAGERRYAATRHDVLPRGGIPAHQLPQEAARDMAVTVRIGRPPAHGGVVSLEFVAGEVAAADLKITLNGEATDAAPRVETGRKGRRRISVEFPAAAFVPGENIVCAAARPGSSARLVWCEITAD